MQTKTKTNKNRTAPIEAAQTTKRTTSCSFLTSKSTRPKTLIVHMQRTTNGYTIKEATGVSRINQHATKQVPVSVRAVTEDINLRGISI